MINFKEYQKHLLVHLKEHELEKLVLKIKESLTTNRAEIENYTLNEKEVAAYTAFYGYSNLHKLVEVFKWLPTEVIENLSKTNLIDIGSGPGVFCLAWAELFKDTKEVSIIESSELMKIQAKKMISALHPNISVKENHFPEDSCMLFGHSFNEIGVEESYDLIKKADPKYILLIEPGTKDTFFNMLKLREKLLAINYQIVFPCQAQTVCPLENQDKDWCHQFLNIRYNQDFESLSQKLKIDRKKLPITVHLYQKNEVLKFKDHEARVIRVYKPTKFSYEFDLCHQNKTFKFEVMKKHYKKSEQKELEKIKSGDLVFIEIQKQLSDNLHRGMIKIKED